ncbi:hypothetical protein FEZ62_20350 [Pseudomonas sp. MS19]|nr:hypothetical protein [Pseudomonas sp. MS19]
MVADEPVIKRFNLRTQTRTTRVTRRDYDFEKPSTKLESAAETTFMPDLEDYDYPGRFTQQEHGKQLTSRALERQRSDYELVEGRSDQPSLVSGHFLALSNHPKSEWNDLWLINEVRHEGKQPQVLEESVSSDTTQLKDDFDHGYRNVFIATPWAVIHRPPLRHPRPRILGSQSAVVTAISRYRLGMGPINLLLLGLGVSYFYAWWKQATPVQRFLAGCCWSRLRTIKYEIITPNEQVSELEELLNLLYTPRVSIETSGSLLGSSSYISQLSIDLPSAVPTTARLAFALAGNPVYMPASHGQSLFGGGRMIDIGAQWLSTSECTWIPADEGQGLRLTGPFLINDLFGSQPSKVSMRLGYHSPIATLAGVEPIVGGIHGLAFTVDSDGEIIELRSTELPSELIQATIHPLGNAECSIYLQPKGHP